MAKTTRGKEQVTMDYLTMIEVAQKLGVSDETVEAQNAKA